MSDEPLVLPHPAPPADDHRCGRGVVAYRYLVGTGRLRHHLRFGAFLPSSARQARRLVAERREFLGEL